MKRTRAIGITPRSKVFKIKIKQTTIGIGFGDFADSVPRFAYFGEILHPGLRIYLFRIWNFAVQVVTLLKRIPAARYGYKVEEP